jgi:hypothetical protein
MKLPILPHDIETGKSPDMQQLWENCAVEDRPDAYLWVESVYGYFPQHIDKLPCRKACYLIDMHINLHLYLDFARQFDSAFVVHRQFVPNVREIVAESHWLPVACDPAIHRSSGTQKVHDVSFVGSLVEGTRRYTLLKKLTQKVPVHVERCFWDEMAALFSESRIVFNNGVSEDLNMRFFEVLSTGTLLLSDMAQDSGQEELFVAGEDYALYRDDNLEEVAQYYLAHEQTREAIAQRGQRLVHAAHTYDHRVQDLLSVVLRGKADTWSAEELREQSLRGLSERSGPCHDDAISAAARDLVGQLVESGKPDAALRICNCLLRELPGNSAVSSLVKFTEMYVLKSKKNEVTGSNGGGN